MQYSNTFERDWSFYLNSQQIFTFCGKTDRELWQKVVSCSTGKTAKECFYSLDSKGKVVPCSEPDILYVVLRTKAAVNLQIAQWAEMVAGGVLWPFEMKEIDHIYQLPDWVIKAVYKQAESLCIQRQNRSSER